VTASARAGAPGAHADPAEDLSLEDYFQRFVIEHQDSMSETELAQKLGISRKCLWERRQRFGIPRRKGSTRGRKTRKLSVT
jgi:two-component system response regulator HydG